MLDYLLQKIEDRNYRIGIIGLGYVGLPLLWTFYQKGFSLTGFDVDQQKTDELESGKSYIKHFRDEQISEMMQSGRVQVTTDFTRVDEVDAILMCVPTPLDDHREPDMSYVETTVETIGPNLKKGHLLVLESTTYPGTTDELIKPLAEELSGLESGRDFYLAYSPEREDPGNVNFQTASIPKVVGAEGEEALKLACAMYDAAIVETVPVSSARTAEAVKLLENIFRAVNIALVNELKVVFEKMDIDIYEVINAAKTKPFGFMAFYPGPGLGGHCIPIDPFYLTWRAREYDINTRFIELAGEVNTSMPSYVLERTIKALNSKKKALNGSKILCLGLAYKPNVDDMRESPTYVIMDLLSEYGAEVDYHDPYIPVIPETREHANWAGKKSIEWSEKKVSGYDAVIICTDHDDIDYEKLLNWQDCIVDTRNAMNTLLNGNGKVWKA